MTELNPGYGSPFVQGARTTSPKEVMFRLRKQHPQASKEELFQLFKKEANADPDLADVCIEIAAINSYNAWEKLTNPRISAREREERNEERQEIVRAQAAEVAVRIQRAVILDFIMPNGKPLRACTFREVGKFGKGFQKIAAAGRPNQVVGEVLSESKVQSLMR